MKLKNLSLLLLILSLIPTVIFAQISLKEDSIELFLKQKMGQLRIPALQIAIINDGKVV